jgi:outer membrane protein OmpA-like peptidoglycan-associated protein
MLKKLGKKAAESASENKSDDSSKKDETNNDNKESNADSAKEPENKSEAAPESTASTGGQPNLLATPIDFVPGEKTLFYDDFTDMPPGEPPPHWKVRGGVVELRMGGGIRELTVPHPDEVILTSPSIQVPRNFTFQAEMSDHCAVDWGLRDKEDHNQLWVELGPPPSGPGKVEVQLGPNSLGSSFVQVDPAKPVDLALWNQDGRIRVYVNGTRAIDVNQVTLEKPIDHVVFSWPNWGGCNGSNGLRNVRVAESAPDPGLVLASTGRFVTHGIHFDTDSDRLQPDSAAVIKEISSTLYKNPSLKLEIDGYTDSTGDAAHNMELSKKRAEAVKTVLIEQFGIDQGRLSANGFGADKPISSNDTAEGRAMNRRVEFVKK